MHPLATGALAQLGTHRYRLLHMLLCAYRHNKQAKARFAGIMHRDIKLENIVFTDGAARTQGSVRLLDFGDSEFFRLHAGRPFRAKTVRSAELVQPFHQEVYKLVLQSLHSGNTRMGLHDNTCDKVECCVA
jgi:serine/threonine protein kinase